jgi:hypothetical protein
VLDLAHLNVNWNKPYLTEAPFILVIMKHVKIYVIQMAQIAKRTMDLHKSYPDWIFVYEWHKTA